MEAGCFSETLTTIYMASWYHNPRIPKYELSRPRKSHFSHFIFVKISGGCLIIAQLVICAQEDRQLFVVSSRYSSFVIVYQISLHCLRKHQLDFLLKISTLYQP
jgi:hypothetical protein